MRRTNIYLDDGQLRALDRLAADEGTSRAELIRRVIDRWLSGGDHDLERDLAAIDDSFGALADIEAPERAPDERAQHLQRMWKLRG